jgi:ATP-dependent Clp protease ATP-binding subunit ClpB
MLQIFDDGRLTDGQGRTVDFKNTILIMTSNIGSREILGFKGGPSGDEYQRMKTAVIGRLQIHFRPEFLNRIDEIIVFHSLRQEDLKKIVKIQLGNLEQRLADRKIGLQLTEAAIDHLIRVGFDPNYGARPLKRAIQREVENQLGRLLLQGSLGENQTVKVSFNPDSGQLEFTHSPSSRNESTS